jgi:hypothetical protein
MGDAEPALVAPAAELVLGVPRGVRRVVPVEIDEDVQVLGEVVVPEALEEGPVDESLNVVLARRDAKKRDPALELHGRGRPRQLAAELRDVARQLHAFGGAHAGGSRADPVVGELSQRRLHLVHVHGQMPARAHALDEHGEGASRIRRVVDHLVRGDKVELRRRHGRAHQVRLREVHVRQVAELTLSDVDRAAEIQAHDQRARRELREASGVSPRARARIEHQLFVRQELAQSVLVAEAEPLDVPGVLLPVPLPHLIRRDTGPLRSEALESLLLVVLGGHQARNRLADGPLVAALAAQRSLEHVRPVGPARQAERALVVRAGQNVEQGGLHARRTVVRASWAGTASISASSRRIKAGQAYWSTASRGASRP